MVYFLGGGRKNQSTNIFISSQYFNVFLIFFSFIYVEHQKNTYVSVINIYTELVSI